MKNHCSFWFALPSAGKFSRKRQQCIDIDCLHLIFFHGGLYNKAQVGALMFFFRNGHGWERTNIQMPAKKGNAIQGNTRLVRSVVIKNHSCKMCIFQHVFLWSRFGGMRAFFALGVFCSLRKSTRKRSRLTKQGKPGKTQEQQLNSAFPYKSLKKHDCFDVLIVRSKKLIYTAIFNGFTCQNLREWQSSENTVRVPHVPFCEESNATQSCAMKHRFWRFPRHFDSSGLLSTNSTSTFVQNTTHTQHESHMLLPYAILINQT